ncbi:hypothetical protein K461DRAFT_10481 [Myriangium duriaei CBS 260.36]|uniref:Uncharacterized protein n=1 Tax=Myriangium duriaei CBS 260.36 TaxID=1168546 RepID=A0A9P4JDM9_9PEZI|nr:hypothetical protein K461DRAFT_10481 [Myriangium duriaei CBS 260.36]
MHAACTPASAHFQLLFHPGEIFRGLSAIKSYNDLLTHFTIAAITVDFHFCAVIRISGLRIQAGMWPQVAHTSSHPPQHALNIKHEDRNLLDYVQIYPNHCGPWDVIKPFIDSAVQLANNALNIPMAFQIAKQLSNTMAELENVTAKTRRVHDKVLSIKETSDSALPRTISRNQTSASSATPNHRRVLQ